MAASAAAEGDWHLYDIDLDALLHGHDDLEHPHGYWEKGDY
jgi:hypothetical protein